jgi:serine/threonine protein kinase HipA of HipAB toxin-antitoxin module
MRLLVSLLAWSLRAVLTSRGSSGLEAIAAVLHGSELRDHDLAMLLRARLLFWMLAAIDGHA